MTNASIKNSFAVLAVALGLVLSMGTFVTTAHAQYDNGWGSVDNGWGSYDNGWGSYDNGWGSYDNGWGSVDNGSGYYNNPVDTYSGCGMSCYSGGGYGGGFGGYSAGGGFGGGCGMLCSTPRYSASPFTIGVAPVGRPYGTPYIPPITASAPSSQQQQQSQSSYNSNPNTNTNVNNGQPINITNTNINNNTAPVTPVAQTPIQHIVQYVMPSYQPTYPALSCSITASRNSLRAGETTYLGWSSTGASSAILSDGIGAVAPSGSVPIRPGSSRTYTLTVYGQGQQATCTTYVTVGNAPYVALNQIPYTGFDFGPFGNTIYWAGLLSLALAIAYLAIYYKGGLAFAMNTGRPTTREQVAQMRRDNKRAMSATVAAAVSETPRTVLSNLPTREMRSSTADAMSIAVSSKADEMPRIVITRD